MPVVVPCSTTFTVTACSVRLLGLAVPSTSTVTGTTSFRVAPSFVASTVTVPFFVGNGTFGSITLPSPSISATSYDVLLMLSTRVTVAPLSTVKVTPGNTLKVTFTVASRFNIEKEGAKGETSSIPSLHFTISDSAAYPASGDTVKVITSPALAT